MRIKNFENCLYRNNEKHKEKENYKDIIKCKMVR